jgi:LPS export ABC transporter protein LptC
MPESAGSISRRAGLKRPAAFLGCACAALLLAAGCSINYDEATAAEQAPPGIPDTVATDLVHRVHKNGRLTIQLEASRAETYNAKNETILKDAHFSEFDATGATATEGSAKTLVFHNDTQNAEIWGSVHVHSATEKGDVRADTLTWENKPKLLKAPPAERVVITKDDGSAIAGSGFQGDFLRRELTFDGPVQGTYVWENKK